MATAGDAAARLRELREPVMPLRTSHPEPERPTRGKGVLKWSLLLSIALVGCATPYRPIKAGTGFSDKRIAPDEFEVGFQANGQTSPQQASDFALLRAAEITLENGFTCFAVVDITNTSSAKVYTARQRFYSDYPPAVGLPPPSPGLFDSSRFGYIVEYDRPGVFYRPGERLLIKCFKSKPEKPFTYEARELKQSLTQKYKIRQASRVRS